MFLFLPPLSQWLLSHEPPASDWRHSYQSLWWGHHWHTTVGGAYLMVWVGLSYWRGWGLFIDVVVLVNDVGGLGYIGRCHSVCSDGELSQWSGLLAVPQYWETLPTTWGRKLPSLALLQTPHLLLRAIEREGGGGERESRVREGGEQDFPVLVD